MIYASTNQVVFGFRADEPYKSLFAGRFDDISPEEIRPIDHTQPTRPLNYYACSKVFGEALAHMYAHTHGLSCICLRIGWVTADDQPPHPQCAHPVVQPTRHCSAGRAMHQRARQPGLRRVLRPIG